MDWLPVAFVVVLAMGFTYTNGFHDAANAIATSVSTRALTPRIALALAAVMNLLGGFVGVRVAQTIGGDIIEVPRARRASPSAPQRCSARSAGTCSPGGGACRRRRRTPSSGAWGCGTRRGRDGEVGQHPRQRRGPDGRLPRARPGRRVPVMTAILWMFRRAAPGPTARGFRYAQTVSAAAMAFGHGMQDAAKAAGVVVARPRGQWLPGRRTTCPCRGGPSRCRPWSSASARMPGAGGSCARSAAASSTSTRRRASPRRRCRPRCSTRPRQTGAPISTTHAISSAIMGVGATAVAQGRPLGRRPVDRRRRGCSPSPERGSRQQPASPS